MLLVLTYSAQSQDVLMNTDSVVNKTKIFIPIVFYNQVLKFALAVSYSENGNVQDQGALLRPLRHPADGRREPRRRHGATRAASNRGRSDR